MKVTSKAKQKNVMLNKAMYNLTQVNEMLKNREICYFNGCYEESYEELTSSEFDNQTLRIFTQDLKTINVILDEYGYYQTVACGNNNKVYYIEL